MDPLEEMEHEKNMREFENALKTQTAQAPGYAKAVRTYYQELLKQGFNEIQALEIVKHHGYMPPFQTGK